MNKRNKNRFKTSLEVIKTKKCLFGGKVELPKETIIKKIDNFGGGIESACSFIKNIYKEVNIDFESIYISSDAEKKFAVFVRGIINKAVIKSPKKLGRVLILGSVDVLSILVTKKYMNVGIPIKNLVGKIIHKTKSELYEDLFNDQLSEIKYILDSINDNEVFRKVIELSIKEDMHFDIGDEFIIDMKEVIDLKKGDTITLTIKRD